jgi:hypothetical protein
MCILFLWIIQSVFSGAWPVPNILDWLILSPLPMGPTSYVCKEWLGLIWHRPTIPAFAQRTAKNMRNLLRHDSERGSSQTLIRNVTVWANMFSDWEIEGGATLKHTYIHYGTENVKVGTELNWCRKEYNKLLSILQEQENIFFRCTYQLHT